MGLIKEAKNIDLSTKSEPWTEKELSDLKMLNVQLENENYNRKVFLLF